MANRRMVEWSDRDKFAKVLDKFLDDNNIEKNSETYSSLLGTFAKKVIIQNWFNREHFEHFMNLEEGSITEDEFLLIVRYMYDNLADFYSDVFRDAIREERHVFEEVIGRKF